MQICLITENGYPFLPEAEEGWTQALLESMGQRGQRYTVVSVAETSQSGEPLRPLPTSVEKLYTIPLRVESAESRTKTLGAQEQETLRRLVLGSDVPWEDVFQLFRRQRPVPASLVRSEGFFSAVMAAYRAEESKQPFAAYLAALRDFYQPLFTLLREEPPQAALYQSRGGIYAGLLGCMGKALHGAPLLLSPLPRSDAEGAIRLRMDWLRRDILRRADKIVCRDAAEQEALAVEGFSAQLLTDAFFLAAPAALRAPVRQIGCTPVAASLSGETGAWILDAFRAARQRSAGLSLLAAGNAEQDTDGVTLAGVPLPALLAQAEAVILPKDGAERDALSALAAERPILAPEGGSTAALIHGDDGYGPAGIVLSPPSEALLAAALVYLAEHPDIAALMGRVGRKRMNDRLQAGVDAWDALYQSISPETAAEKDEGVAL